MADMAFRVFDGEEKRKKATNEEYAFYIQHRPCTKYRCCGEPNGKKCTAEMIINKGTAYYRNGKKVEKAPYFSTLENSRHAPGCDYTPKYEKTISVLSKNIEDISLFDFFMKIVKKSGQKKTTGGGKGPRGGEGPTTDGGETERIREGDPNIRRVQPSRLEQMYLALINCPKDAKVGGTISCEEALINSRSYEKARKGELDLIGIRLVVAERCRVGDVIDFTKENRGKRKILVMQDPYIGPNGQRIYYLLRLDEPEGGKAWRSRHKLTEDFFTSDKLWLVMGNWEQINAKDLKYTIFATDIPTDDLIEEFKLAEIEQMLRRDK